ncbi:MAG: hypothetical protein PHE89_08140 [Alphaproteobacteria bacterium]|nr:hypothetical protein [Alphaproteobacteria bacterium]
MKKTCFFLIPETEQNQVSFKGMNVVCGRKPATFISQKGEEKYIQLYVEYNSAVSNIEKGILATVQDVFGDVGGFFSYQSTPRRLTRETFKDETIPMIEFSSKVSVAETKAYLFENLTKVKTFLPCYLISNKVMAFYDEKIFTNFDAFYRAVKLHGRFWITDEIRYSVMGYLK